MNTYTALVREPKAGDCTGGPGDLVHLILGKVGAVAHLHGVALI